MGGGRGNDINDYRTVTIGTSTWMAENLDYAIDGSVCYGRLKSNCDKYGRLYTWKAAMRACPAGWHLPDNDEWTALETAVGSNPGTKLKSKSGWDSYGLSGDVSGNGTDNYDFSGLPGGNGGYDDGSFRGVGRIGYWWSATEFGASASGWYLKNDERWLDGTLSSKPLMYSVRCVED
jgi:uncharacterized protein (TIGR02145 family)